MSATPNPPEQPAAANDSLQFDRAEFDQGAALSCSGCNSPISGQYFQVNGQVACPNCRQQIDTAFSGGSKPGRAVKAFAAGIAAAIAGFVVYWGIRAATGYEFGLVAILIGFMVGGAVRWGAEKRGGLFYQLMAVVLTYMSIASNYTPDVIQGLRQRNAEDTAVEASADVAIQNGETKTAPAAATSAPSTQGGRSLPLWFELIFGFIVSLAVPFMGGVSNIIGWLIIGFGLLQAWQMNKRIPLTVAGPFNNASPQAPTFQT